MLNKKNRLTKNKEFDNAFKKGRGSYSKVVGVKAVFNNLPDTRFGAMVSLKVSKKAVERNKLKRQIREILQENLPILKPGFDIVIIAQPNASSADFQALKEDIGRHFKKLRLYQG